MDSIVKDKEKIEIFVLKVIKNLCKKFYLFKVLTGKVEVMII